MSKISAFIDCARRPKIFIRDQVQCSATWFSLGNTLFAGATGAIAGIDLGISFAGAAIQGALTIDIMRRQANATYNGKGFGTPFKLLAYANYTTAASLLGVGMMSGGAGLTMVAFPVLTFLAWGRGHQNLGNLINRVEHFKSTNRADLIDKDLTIKNLTKWYQALYGVADISAVLKDKPLNEVTALLTQPLANIDSILPMLFFGVGLKKSFSNAIEKEMSSNRLYAAGYGVGAALSLFKPTFALAQACWARAYYCLDIEKAEPESAINFAKRMGYSSPVCK